jgi:hypothetical protein
LRVLSVAREIGVECNRDLPMGPAEVLSITGSVGAHGGRVFRSIEMRAERSRHYQHMLVWENIHESTYRTQADRGRRGGGIACF